MDFIYSYDSSKVDYQELMSLLKKAGMGTYTKELHEKAFKNSFKTIFIFDNKKLIGCGRLISDGAYQGGLYDIAIDNEYQGLGLGKLIIDKILEDLEPMNIILYASVGKEGFYEKMGFRLAKTGMIKFINQDLMEEKGFI